MEKLSDKLWQQKSNWKCSKKTNKYVTDTFFLSTANIRSTQTQRSENHHINFTFEIEQSFVSNTPLRLNWLLLLLRSWTYELCSFSLCVVSGQIHQLLCDNWRFGIIRHKLKWIFCFSNTHTLFTDDYQVHILSETVEISKLQLFIFKWNKLKFLAFSFSQCVFYTLCNKMCQFHFNIESFIVFFRGERGICAKMETEKKYSHENQTQCAQFQPALCLWILWIDFYYYYSCSIQNCIKLEVKIR